MAKHEYKIIGMDCAEEVAIVKRALAPLEDEKNLRFDLLNGKLTVETLHPRESLESALAKSGMKAVLWATHKQAENIPQHFFQRRNREILSGISGASILLGLSYFLIAEGPGALFLSEDKAVFPQPSIALFILGIVTGGYYVAPKAWYALVNLRADMNLLMCIAVCGALFLGEYLEAATVAFLFSAALLLESWSVGRARRAVETLLDLSPKTARYLCPCDGDVMEKPIAEVPLGATVLVRPGERIPLDGEVSKGASNVNEAPITGESMPVAKEPGALVYAGSVNLDGSLEFRATRAAGDTQLAHIILLVNEAQGNRSVSEQWVEKFARYYTPAMIVVATLTALALPLLGGVTWQQGLYQAMVVLLIACPCALVISTPVSIVSGLARAARNGVLIKGGTFLELPAKIEVMAFDKTGTLSTGKPSVSAVQPLNGHSETELLTLAAGVESHSAHPLAQAICAHAAKLKITPSKAENFLDTPGKGAEAWIGGEKYWVGNMRFLKEHGHAGMENDTPNLRGQSLVYIGNEEHICGYIGVQDTVREESKMACGELRNAGIKELMLLSGDHESAVRQVAHLVGIENYQAGLLPQDKAEIINGLIATGIKVAMVGDGVNDAPAMAAATLSIAMGAAGSDTAIQTADVALMTDDLRKIAWLIRHSHRSLGIIKQNIALALGLKLLVLGLVFAGWGALWFAIAADMGASLLVTFNALRLLRD